MTRTRITVLIAVAAIAVSAAALIRASGDKVQGHAKLAPGAAEQLDRIAGVSPAAIYTQTGESVRRVGRAVGDALS